jgi:hypothetical protein
LGIAQSKVRERSYFYKEREGMNSTFLMRTLLVVYFVIFFLALGERNYPRALYWFAAGLITLSVLWGMK